MSAKGLGSPDDLTVLRLTLR